MLLQKFFHVYKAIAKPQKRLKKQKISSRKSDLRPCIRSRNPHKAKSNSSCMQCSRLLPYRRCHRCGSSACCVRSGNPLRGGTPHCPVPSKRLCQDNCGRRSSRRRGNRQCHKDNAIPHCAAVCRPVLPALHTENLCLCIAAHERIQPKIAGITTAVISGITAGGSAGAAARITSESAAGISVLGSGAVFAHVCYCVIRLVDLLQLVVCKILQVTVLIAIGMIFLTNLM